MNIVEESWKDSAEVLQAFQYVEAGSAVIIDASLQDLDSTTCGTVHQQTFVEQG